MNTKKLFFSSQTLAIIGLILFGYIVFDNWWRILFTQPFLSREKILVQAEASNIETFFETFGDSVSVLANLNSVENFKDYAMHDLDAFVEQWKDSNITGGVTLINEQGLTTINSNLTGAQDVGVSLADRDYFVWAKNNSSGKNYFIGKPVVSRIGKTKGSIIIPVAATVMVDSKFKGVIASSSRLANLTDHFVARFNVTEFHETFLTDASGTILYSSKHPDYSDSNLTEIFPEPSFLGSKSFDKKFGKALKSSNTGTMTALFINPETNKLSLRFITHTKVRVGQQEWFLFMTTPISGLLRFDTSVYIRMITSSVSLVIIYIVYRRVVSRKA